MNFHYAGCLAMILAAGLLVGLQPARSQTSGPAAHDSVGSITNAVLTVQVKDYSISGLVTHLPQAKAFKYGIALFPGAPGILKLREEAGQPRFMLGGNFLIRSRRHWLDEETLVISIDAPSDQWGSFSQWFRMDPRYGADVAALLGEVSRRYAVKDWTLVGTSEGSVSAFHVARMNPALAQRLILTSSLFHAAGHGPGLTGVNWDEMKARLLWVHHADDGCRFTPHRTALQYAEMTHAPLVTVRGGDPGRGSPCEAFSQHGFVGIERDTVLAMRSWIKTGVVPADVVPQ
jgi:hypothetical protein